MRSALPALTLALSLALIGGAVRESRGATLADSAAVADEAAAAETAGEKSASEKYVYDPVGKRDPFQSLMEIRKPVAKANEPQTPLQKFDLSQLRMVGAIVGMSSPRAMVVAPDGKSYILKIGTKVGKNNGVVVKIMKDKVDVKESFYDFTGEVRTSTQTIELPKREGV